MMESVSAAQVAEPLALSLFTPQSLPIAPTSPPHPPSWVVRILRPVWITYGAYVTVHMLVQRACAGALATSTEWVVRLGPYSPALL